MTTRSTAARKRVAAAPTPRKTFRFQGRKAKSTEPIPFEIVVGEGPKERVEEFHAKPRVAGFVLLEFMDAGTDQAHPQRVAAAIPALFREAIPSEDWDRFEKVLRDPSIEIEDLGDIAEWLVEEYADRPTE